ncbi:MAG: histidine triad nucleotide-binding protein [Verrucomicrobiota bacterium]|nr:histidine triad nucleotide-binding protein [Verrucomicrobiota bacterium]
MTLFEKIINRQIPATFEHEDEVCIAIRDVSPQAPHHLLIIPKKPIPRLAEASDNDAQLLGHLLIVARNLAKKLQLDAGFRIVINNGSHGGESVPHLHVHLLAGRPLKWPPG